MFGRLLIGIQMSSMVVGGGGCPLPDDSALHSAGRGVVVRGVGCPLPDNSALLRGLVAGGGVCPPLDSAQALCNSVRYTQC